MASPVKSLGLRQPKCAEPDSQRSGERRLVDGRTVFKRCQIGQIHDHASCWIYFPGEAHFHDVIVSVSVRIVYSTGA